MNNAPLKNVLKRLFFPLFVLAYIAVVIAWLLAWWPAWVLTGKNILADSKPPFRWMDDVL